MSGGRGGLGSVLHSQSRGSRRFATFAFFASLLAARDRGPGWVIAKELNNDDLPYAHVTDLTEDEKHGQELFGTRCSLCHTLKAANAVATVGPDLDALAPERADHARRDREGSLRQRSDAGRSVHRQGRGRCGEICRKVRGRFGVVRRLM